MQATELCTYVLSIDDYGQVKSVGVNEGGLHMDIHIGFRPFPRAWFNRTHKWVCTKCYAKLKASEASEIKVWRHTNLGSLSTYVNVPIPQGFHYDWNHCSIMSPWGGPASPFTAALQLQVIHALEHSDSAQSACRSLDMCMESSGATARFRYVRGLTSSHGGPYCERAGGRRKLCAACGHDGGGYTRRLAS